MPNTKTLNGMTPREFHEACYDAICECPQFQGYDDDTYFEGYGEFGNIHKKGLHKVIKFWMDDDLLWNKGYSEALPQEVLEVFERIDSLVNKAIKEALK